VQRLLCKWSISTAVIATAAALTVRLATQAAFSTPTARNLLQIALRPQEKANWCWAATSQMTMEFGSRNGGQNVTQCNQASKKLNLDTIDKCCSSIVDCDVAGWPIFDLFKFDADQTDHAPLKWDDLKREIDDQRPFCFAMKWQDSILGRGTGHMVLVHGYEVDAQGQKWVHVIDPEPLPNPAATDPDLKRGGDVFSIRYEDYVENKTNGAVNSRWGGYSHWNDYFNVRPAGP
jgi:hypothetical protein